MHQTVMILDFGSQYTKLIARKVRELNVYSVIEPFDIPLDEIREREPSAIILSGGPASIYAESAPRADSVLGKNRITKRAELEVIVARDAFYLKKDDFKHIMGTFVFGREDSPTRIELEQVKRRCNNISRQE